MAHTHPRTMLASFRPGCITVILWACCYGGEVSILLWQQCATCSCMEFLVDKPCHNLSPCSDALAWLGGADEPSKAGAWQAAPPQTYAALTTSHDFATKGKPRELGPPVHLMPLPVALFWSPAAMPSKTRETDTCGLRSQGGGLWGPVQAECTDGSWVRQGQGGSAPVCLGRSSSGNKSTSLAVAGAGAWGRPGAAVVRGRLKVC